MKHEEIFNSIRREILAGKYVADIRRAGFDGLKTAADLGIVTCRQPIVGIAETALETLLSRIKTPSLPVRTLLLHAPLAVCDSDCQRFFAQFGIYHCN